MAKAPVLDPFQPASAADVLCNCQCGRPIPRGHVQRGIRYLKGHKISPQALRVSSRDLPATALLAGVTGDCDTSRVVLSGRCPACGYLRASAGHEITCG